MNIYITLGLIVAAFISGWTVNTWYIGYKGEHSAIHAEEKASAGETKIIHDTQVITKMVYREKDDCINKPVPADLLNQLH